MLQLTLGLLIGVFVLSQSVYLKPEVQKDSQEQSEEKVPETAQVVTSEAVTSTTLQFNLGFQSYLMEEILQPEVDQKKTLFQEYLLPSINKALKMLLSRIIAPNAP